VVAFLSLFLIVSLSFVLTSRFSCFWSPQLDKKDRVIGFAVMNASKHFNDSMLKDLSTDMEWIKLASFSTEFDSIDSVKVAKKAKKMQKKAQASEAARAVAVTSSTPLFGADSSTAARESVLMHHRSRSPSKSTWAQKKKVYTGVKINLIPHDGIASDCNTSDESTHTYFSNRFVRDLEWVLNFPFILREKSLMTSSGSIPPPPISHAAEVLGDRPLPLVETRWLDLGKPTHEFLSELDRNPELYLPWIKERQARSNNLGGYFTMLIEFLLSQSIDTKQVLPKYQMLSGEKRTVGDFDFLLQLKETPENPGVEPWVHWEVGIKFYLLLENESPENGSAAFVGPHCTGDSLEKYITKTVRQLDLCHVDWVEEQLKADSRFPSSSSFFLKGYVFFPLTPAYYEREQDSSSVPFWSGNRSDPYEVDYWVETSGWLYNRRTLTSACMNGGPIAGWWTKYHHKFPYGEDGTAADASADNFELIRNDPSLEEDILLLEAPPMTLAKAEKVQHSMWTILNKMDYMSPLLVTPDRPDIQLLSYAALKKAIKMCFATNYSSLFVAEVIPYSRSQYQDCPNPLRVTHVEVSRGFIVGEHWPMPPRGISPVDAR